MRRREFLSLAGAMAVARPNLSLAQAPTKRLAFINAVPENDPTMTPFLESARQGLASQGWVEGRNLEIKYWFAINHVDVDGAQVAAMEAIDFRPDVIMTVGPDATEAAAGLTQMIPIVNFAGQPFGPENVSRPTGNLTGFTQADPMLSGKLVELLKEVSPLTQRVAILADSSEISATNKYLFSFLSSATALGMEPTVLITNIAEEIDQVLDTFGRGPEAGAAGLNNSAFVLANHAATTAAYLRNKQPFVYGNLVQADEGVVNYYIDSFDAIRRVGEYAGMILGGAKVAELPTQAPTKYLLTVNMKTAKLLDLAVPQGILLRADRVIE